MANKIVIKTLYTIIARLEKLTKLNNIETDTKVYINDAISILHDAIYSESFDKIKW